ncbi:hypothetical protein HCN44_005574 [Aphidius gifuensis]|uniref:rhomboid protease n=1 Tax=Aphidius gifuensis TaxID=684658 RepID=A0A834Y5V1_APHGI|nr:presenilins-associated rhomboid-like protein, mitochondrial [Aphidius gifuensis]KAF7997297.1 hypothetical protein HCN44_005574 [Aphidius gifuensis]
MAFRTLINYGQTGRCIFTNVNCQRNYLNVKNTTRFFKTFRDSSNGNIKSRNLFDTTIPSSGNYLKPIGFAILFAGVTHAGATIWEYEKIRNRAWKVINRYQERQVPRTGWRLQAETWWRSLTEGQRIFVPICFLNILVFGAWRIPALQSTMLRYFVASPGSRSVCLPMIYSTFSHSSLVHLGLNMYVLQSFITPAVQTLGKEQFVALYLTSGMMASLLSHLHKVAFKMPSRSLGASGAIMGIVGFICLTYPDVQLGVAFLPMITFSAANALKGLIAMDTIGCVFRMKLIDHAAHLGGVFWGMFWQMWGNSHIWGGREPLLNLWHRYRKPPQKED